MMRSQGGSRQGSGSGRSGKGQNTKDDSIVFKMKTYKLVEELTQAKEVKVDTSITDFHLYHPAYRNSLSVQSLGNIGAEYQPGDFFRRGSSPRSFLFQANYADYGLLPGEITFYNVTKPYTLLSYGQWFANKPKGETILKVLHTQNINKSINFGFYYNSMSASGKYLNQQAKDHTIGLFTSGNFDRYDYWFTIGKNKYDNQENGGLPSPEDIENPDLKPENINVWLTDVNTLNDNSFITLTHQYKLGTWKEVKDSARKEIYQQFIPRVAILHLFDLQKSSRVFTEADPNPSFTYSDDRGKVFFYGKDHVPNINATVGTSSSPATIDKAGQNVMTNKLVLKFLEARDRKYTFGKQAFISNEAVSAWFPREELVTDSLGQKHAPTGLTQSHNFTNTWVGGSAYRTDGRVWNWNLSGKSCVQGRNALDYELAGAIDKPIRSKKDTAYIRIFARMTNQTPDYFLEHYYSNHYKWENSFDKVYTLKAGANFEKPGWRLKASVNYAIINKYVFFNEKALPEQASSEFSVAQAMLNKDFKFGGLHIRNWVVVQKTTTENYLAIPPLTVRNSTYYEGSYAKVLFFQLGLDSRYDKPWYADAYAPATGTFYRQKSLLIGDYAWVDAFINIKIKRTAFYLKYTNLATQFVKGGYLDSPGYPAPANIMCFGLSWSFYN